MIKELISKLADHKDLTFEESCTAMDEIMIGKATPAQIAALITGLRIKGETVDEISGFAKMMREHALPIMPRAPYYVDTCGTGGDVSGTFNISSIASFVAAGAGIVIAKHGNRAISSKCGSADLLETLGIKIDIPPEKVRECIDNIGIGFIFAPTFHLAMKYASPIRKELGIRTIFNILGPVSNPANAKGQFMGVYSNHMTTLMAEVLKKQGCEAAMVVHSKDGIDEISISAKTKVTQLLNGEIFEYFIGPDDVGLKKAPLSSVMGGDADQNAQIAIDVLSGKVHDAKRDIVLFNAAATIIIGKMTSDFREAVRIATESIDSGAAMDKLEKLKTYSNS